MGAFYPLLMRAISPAFRTQPIEPGMLTPYTALLFFGAGLWLSNFLVNTVLMRLGGKTYGEYFSAGFAVHLPGILGGFIWMVALALNVIAAGVAGPAVSFALGQGGTLVAAIWGVFVWKEFRGAPRSGTPLIVLMFGGYAAGLVLVGLASF